MKHIAKSLGMAAIMATLTVFPIWLFLYLENRAILAHPEMAAARQRVAETFWNEPTFPIVCAGLIIGCIWSILWLFNIQLLPKR